MQSLLFGVDTTKQLKEQLGRFGDNKIPYVRASLTSLLHLSTLCFLLQASPSPMMTSSPVPYLPLAWSAPACCFAM